MIQEAYVSFEAAKLLKDKGFKEPCLHYYGKEVVMGEEQTHSYLAEEFLHNTKDVEDNIEGFICTKPSQALVMRWLREVHNLHVDIDPSEGNWYPGVLELEGWSSVVEYDEDLTIQDTYEEACEAAIKYCLENLIQ